MGLIYKFLIFSKKKMSSLNTVSENKVEEVIEEKNNFPKENLLVIKNLLEIVANRGVFKITEFISVGNFYQKLTQVESLENDDFKSIKNVLDLCANRGGFKIEEFDTIFKLNSLILENISE